MKNVFVVVALLLMYGNASAQNDFCSARNTSFKDGERLTFKVFYNLNFVWINAGNAQFNINSESFDGHKAFHISGVGKTAKSYVFFKVNDKYDSYIDKETMLPLKFLRNVSEGSIKFKQDVSFNHRKRVAVSHDSAYKIPKCTQDVLSAIFYARNIDFSKYSPGDKIPFDMFLDDKVYNLYIKYIGKEQIKTKMGVYNAIKIAPLLIEGTIFSGGDKMTIWISDDENHLPLRVDSPILVGSVKVDLVDYENLRNPFTSMISEK